MLLPLPVRTKRGLPHCPFISVRLFQSFYLTILLSRCLISPSSISSQSELNPLNRAFHLAENRPLYKAGAFQGGEQQSSMFYLLAA